ncbi:MAG: LD-carboxypeptidase [Bdellovibrionia bacterium]
MAQRGWKPLEPGDIVDVVAPASACRPAELKRAVKYLKELGFVPRVPGDLFRKRFVFSNSDKYRYEHLRKCLLDARSKAIWCIRGGYGSVRLLPELQKIKRPAHTKLFIGLSDITSVHNFLNQEWNWPTIHGPVLARMGSEAPSKRERLELEKLIRGQIAEVEFRLKPMNAAARKRTRIKSRVVGGNLETISAAQGTDWQVDTRGKILFIEEVNERGYRVDRRLVNLKLTGQLEGAKALVFGDFIGGAEPESGRKMWKDAIQDLAQTLKIPVYSGIHSGHGPLQRPVPFNTKAILSAGRLICETGKA